MLRKIITLIFGLLQLATYAQEELIETHAKKGSVEAQMYLAERYYNGDNGYKQNMSKAYKYYKDAAIQENAQAQWFVYTMLIEGNGVIKNENEANYWLSKAYSHNYPPAVLRVGIDKYIQGNFDEAVNILSRFEHEFGDHPFIWEILGICYMEGLGITKDYKMALKYFGKQITSKSDIPRMIPGEAEFRVGYMFQHGLGVLKDLKTSKEYYQRAISLNPNNELYHIALGDYYLDTGNYNEARKIWNYLLANNPQIIESNSKLAQSMGGSIDYIIPLNSEINTLTYCIIIANENYKRVPNVPHAINDGKIFNKYVNKTLGVPEENIEYLEDASLNDIKYALSNVAQRCNAFIDQINVIVYYAGHGVPDDKTNEAYLLPVDGFGTDPSSGLNLDELYATLSAMPAKSIVVLLDACFSGAKRDGGMLMATRGITIKPKTHVPDGKLIVLSATSNDETAFPIEKQKHGLFTYTLLRKIQETSGDITWGELADYVTETVKNRSIDLNGKLQTPTVSVSPSMKSIWKDIKIR